MRYFQLAHSAHTYRVKKVYRVLDSISHEIFMETARGHREGGDLIKRLRGPNSAMVFSLRRFLMSKAGLSRTQVAAGLRSLEKC